MKKRIIAFFAITLCVGFGSAQAQTTYGQYELLTKLCSPGTVTPGMKEELDNLPEDKLVEFIKQCRKPVADKAPPRKIVRVVERTPRPQPQRAELGECQIAVNRSALQWSVSENATSGTVENIGPIVFKQEDRVEGGYSGAMEVNAQQGVVYKATFYGQRGHPIATCTATLEVETVKQQVYREPEEPAYQPEPSYQVGMGIQMPGIYFSGGRVVNRTTIINRDCPNCYRPPRCPPFRQVYPWNPHGPHLNGNNWRQAQASRQVGRVAQSSSFGRPTQSGGAVRAMPTTMSHFGAPARGGMVHTGGVRSGGWGGGGRSFSGGGGRRR